MLGASREKRTIVDAISLYPGAFLDANLHRLPWSDLKPARSALSMIGAAELSVTIYCPNHVS